MPIREYPFDSATHFRHSLHGALQTVIDYRYINHSNKALRPLNMHLNMRRPRPFFPIPFVRSAHTTTTAAPPTILNTNSTTPNSGKALERRRQSSTGSTVMATIPPSSNPRGELIFSSRVDRTFREGYERYRAAFERRREEKAREEARRNARWFRRRGSGQAALVGGVSGTPTPPASRRGTPPPSLRGRTPSPGVTGSRLRNSVDMGRPPSADGSEGKEGVKEKRDRAESYSFVWSREEGMPRRAP